MRLHTRLIGVFDALILTLTALTMAALLFALISPQPADARLAHAGASSAVAVTLAQTLRS